MDATSRCSHKHKKEVGQSRKLLKRPSSPRTFGTENHVTRLGAIVICIDCPWMRGRGVYNDDM